MTQAHWAFLTGLSTGALIMLTVVFGVPVHIAMISVMTCGLGFGWAVTRNSA